MFSRVLHAWLSIFFESKCTLWSFVDFFFPETMCSFDCLGLHSFLSFVKSSADSDVMAPLFDVVLDVDAKIDLMERFTLDVLRQKNLSMSPSRYFIYLPNCFFLVKSIAFRLFTPAGDLAGLDAIEDVVTFVDRLSLPRSSAIHFLFELSSSEDSLSE